ncbi:MAG TPA: adenylate/guanylate cyclase domain-containing protein [Acidimicrobiales bacterium]|nr:adenylate/guanylate cyclase domain-containing protein [Acidimicrobiales bacterium]
MADVPETRFAQTDDGDHIAYQVIGQGPLDVLVVRSFHFPIDMMWEEPRLVRFLDRLSTFCRHIWFDPRGSGASDRIAPAEGRLSESIMDDMVAVLNACGIGRAAVLGFSVPQSLLFAATHPQRTTALVVVDSPVVVRQCEDNPEGLTAEEIEMESQGRLFSVASMAPSLLTDERFGAWFSRASRLTLSPADQAWRARAAPLVDLRPALSAIQSPTLVVSGTGRRMSAAHGLAAARIAGARLVEIDIGDYLFFVNDPGLWLDAIEEFLTGRLPALRVDRVLATVMFTDVVGSTELAVRLGDRHWKEALALHDTVISSELERFRGREVKSTGDGVLATFDGPGRAIRCAQSIRDALRPSGIEIRAGLHSGEIELRGDDVGGIGVHIAARVAAAAGPSEVLVSRTVSDLVSGSEIEFEDRGDHELKGVPGTWKLFSVRG